MDFTFEDHQTELAQLARRILDDHVTVARLRELEAGDERVDRQLWQALARADLLGLPFGEDVGGGGFGLMELCILLQEVGRRVAPVPVLASIGIAGMAIERFGSAGQRADLLPGIISGEVILSAALEEPGLRDVTRPAATATRDGDGWRLDGVKAAVPWAPIADRILVTAATTGGVGLFLLDPSDDGVMMERGEATHREPQATISLSHAWVGPESVLGDPATGSAAVEWLEQHATAGLCAQAAGVAEEAVRITAAYISERHQFGKPIATFQGATLRTADAYIDTQAISATTWSAIWRLAAGLPAATELAIAKFWVAEGGQRVVGTCQHLHGGIGVDIDYPIHRYFLWAKTLELALGGATDHLLRIGDAIASPA
jgi:3-oxocholest-4-en-26-oyl-CoA dehydrogenase beta subunit